MAGNYDLFTAQSSNGSSATHIINEDGRGAIEASGTWDGASLALEKNVQGTWVAVADADAITADGILGIDIIPGEYRVTLSTVGTSSVNATLHWGIRA